MESEAAGGPVVVTCPRCGGTDVRTVEQARGGKGAMRDDLYGRLAPGPDKTGDGCMHFAEGMLLTGIGIALACVGVQQEKSLYTVGGAALALLCIIGTLVVVRSDGREKAAVEAGAARAERLWRPAHYCSGCASVFCPGGAPWRGALTPEQFKKFVWTEAGYADQLPAGDKAKGAKIPSDALPERL
ncbi:hypothetical protein [Streptomyces lomondensis]|uniref:Integral membrane protein n=1 Tax=Streptomyces lomondensis TaxID=68229 RepID=A0ABQ2XIX7_9ACTN|nr:hypothetical protein [Streptomyces lomondensis]MCF0082745.1 hypothetical protein [Streptomyces lomondensis]GGX18180.1 hypothetical protein GCM10010383_55190 [Streptomyces lomondensis]